MVATTPRGSTESYPSLKPYLFTVAFRMTGSAGDAEDLVQDAWVHYFAAGQPEVTTLRAWLTTVIIRLAIDQRRSARARREHPVDRQLTTRVPASGAPTDPELVAEVGEAVTLAYQMLVDRLTPVQRVVYVLRIAFNLPYQEIAMYAGRSTVACRQIFRRAQLRLAVANQPGPTLGPTPRQRAEPFLAALATGDPARITTALAASV